ncbi:MAG: hypothetical protein JW750_02840 [Anaerolineaceae bacterium]|nr:hypothetical protein [Anaerolineaceae bacterium]
MDKLVKLISKKVGISEAQAKQAVEMVLDFLKKQLPAPLGKQLDAALDGDLDDIDMGDVAGALGGLLGKKK